MTLKKHGSLKFTDQVLVDSVTLTSEVSGVLPVANGGTGTGTFTNGQLLIGNTTGNTLAKATLTGTANQVVVTNGTGTITLSTPQDIGTGSSPSFTGLTVTTTLSLPNGSVILGWLANVGSGTVFYRKTAGGGTPEVQTLATLKTDLGLTGTNSGDQTTTLTGDVTGSGVSNVTTTVKAISGFTGADPAFADLALGYDASATANRQFQVDRLLGLLRIAPGGRLTLTSGTAVTTSDVTGATTIYYTPYLHDVIELWDGTRWVANTFAETSLAIGTVVNGQAYDVFGYLSSGALALEQLEWQSATVTVTIAAPGVVTWTAHGLNTGNTIIFTTSGALPTGLTANTVYYVTRIDANTFKLSLSIQNVAAAIFITTTGTQSGTHTGHTPNARQTAISYQDGRLCKTGDKTRLYLGTYLASSTTTTELSDANLYVQNFYNRVRRPVRKYESTDTWAYNTAAYRAMNGSATEANRINVVNGYPGATLDIKFTALATNSLVGFPGISIGEDSSNTPDSNTQHTLMGVQAAGGYVNGLATLVKFPAVGYHYYSALEWGAGTGVTTWSGDGGAPTQIKCGLAGTWDC